MALAPADIAAAAQRLLDDGYELMVVSNRSVLGELELRPYGLAVRVIDFLAPAPAARAPQAWATADLMRIYNVLNATSFGEKGIPLQNWVMIDLGLLPSAFVLLTLPRARARAVLSDERLGEAGLARVRAVLPAVLAEADRLGYDGPIPVAGYCAAPTPVAGAWVGWSLCSAIPGLGTTVKGVALAVYRAAVLTGVAQFWDPSVRVHRRFGRMEIVSAALGLHPVAGTMVYRTEVGVDDAAETPSFTLPSRDFDAQRELQARIDTRAGRFFILSPGLVDDRVPILERS